VRRTLLDENRRFYDFTSGPVLALVEPQRFNTWPLVRSLLPEFRVDGSRLRPA